MPGPPSVPRTSGESEGKRLRFFFHAALYAIKENGLEYLLRLLIQSGA
ncbi:MAG TPA: hypothetical protein VMV44_09775 [Rectinemataceae bacterium]|nr:hypothetical protein [Rectinemataceae bacterium]